MDAHSRHSSALGDRDHLILDHVMRFRLTTPEVLHRLYFPDTDRNAVTKVTSRLCDRGYLASHPLYGSHIYFTLGLHGAKLKGLARKKVKPLGPQALYRDYGTLAFCCLGATVRKKFRVREIAEQFPEYMGPKLQASQYYLDVENGYERLGIIWVEGGGPIDHIRRSVSDIISVRQAIPKLRNYIDGQRFVVSIVTCDAEKRLEIIAALKHLLTPVAFRVEAIPELLNLLPTVRHD